MKSPLCLWVFMFSRSSSEPAASVFRLKFLYPECGSDCFHENVGMYLLDHFALNAGTSCSLLQVVLFEVASDSRYTIQCYSNSIYNNTLCTCASGAMRFGYMMFYDRWFVFIVVDIFFFFRMWCFMFVERPGCVCYSRILWFHLSNDIYIVVTPI